jgi:thiol-disulfide isomerase/thioredoxin
MALCCIGGVCIPYSALLPLLVWGLRWLIEKISSFGLLPKSLESWLLMTLQIQPKSVSVSPTKQSDCCVDDKNDNKDTTTSDPVLDTHFGCVGEVQSTRGWEKLLETNDFVVAKFTASWCTPCKTIQPLYTALASVNKQARFVTIDADALDDVAGLYKVALLPTFIVFNQGEVVERYSGSDENKLKALIRARAGKTLM